MLQQICQILQKSKTELPWYHKFDWPITHTSVQIVYLKSLYSCNRGTSALPDMYVYKRLRAADLRANAYIILDIHMV